MSKDVLKHARAKIDAEIQVLQDRIRSLRSSRNTLAPIHRLPPEVMTQIFMWVQLLYRGTLERNATDAASLPKWLRATHVCQHWRGVALSSKALYTTILSHNLKYSQAVLDLSGSASLSLIDTVDYGVGSIWKNEDLRASVLAALPRVQSLWLELDSEEFLLPHIEKSNLAFEELCLYQWRSVPTTIFPISLRYLRLSRCCLPSYEGLSRLSNMVELTLIPTFNSEKIPVDALLDILDGMPRLISLELSSVFEYPSTHVGQRRSQVKPILQNLRLYDFFGSIAQFLPLLTFAPRFTIDIVMGSDNCPGDLLQMIFEQVGRHLRASSMTLRTAKLTWNPINPFKNAEISISEGEVEPCVQLGQKVENKSMLLTWLKCVEALPFDDIVSLVVDAPCDAGAWDNNLGHCGTVPRLILPNEQASLGFLKYLIATTEAGKGRRSGADTPFKSLEELTLHGVQYDRDLKSKVQAALTARNKRGFKLRKLTLQDCSVSAGSIKQLSKVVDVVEQHGEMKKGKQGNRV